VEELAVTLSVNPYQTLIHDMAQLQSGICGLELGFHLTVSTSARHFLARGGNAERMYVCCSTGPVLAD
jgi:hypothetical protein